MIPVFNKAAPQQVGLKNLVRLIFNKMTPFDWKQMNTTRKHR